MRLCESVGGFFVWRESWRGDSGKSREEIMIIPEFRCLKMTALWSPSAIRLYRSKGLDCGMLKDRVGFLLPVSNRAD